jgi:hypothetical protein
MSMNITTSRITNRTTNSASNRTETNTLGIQASSRDKQTKSKSAVTESMVNQHGRVLVLFSQKTQGDMEDIVKNANDFFGHKDIKSQLVMDPIKWEDREESLQKLADELPENAVLEVVVVGHGSLSGTGVHFGAYPTSKNLDHLRLSQSISSRVETVSLLNCYGGRHLKSMAENVDQTTWPKLTTLRGNLFANKWEDGGKFRARGHNTDGHLSTKKAKGIAEHFLSKEKKSSNKTIEDPNLKFGYEVSPKDITKSKSYQRSFNVKTGAETLTYKEL